MEGKVGKNLWLVLFFALMLVRLRGEEESNHIAQGQKNATSLTKNEDKSNKTHNEVVVADKRRNNGGGSGGGFAWGWGGGGGGGSSGGGGSRGGGWGWGWGGGSGGGVSWQWGRKKQPSKRGPKKKDFQDDDYKIGEFAQCMVRGRCMGMRLDCPLHCGGPCFYDCRHMCKAHCNH